MIAPKKKNKVMSIMANIPILKSETGRKFKFAKKNNAIPSRVRKLIYQIERACLSVLFFFFPSNPPERNFGERTTPKWKTIKRIFVIRNNISAQTGNQAARPSGVTAFPASRPSRSLNNAIRDCARPRN